MTKRAHRRRAGLFAPRLINADTRYGVHSLDSSQQEIRAGSPADPLRSIVPTGYPGWQHSKSPVIQKCLILIERGLRGIPLENVPAQLLEGLDPDLAELANLAGLSERETDVLALVGNGWKQREIAGWLEVDQATVSRRLHSGREKLAIRLPRAVAKKFHLGAQTA